MQISINSIRYIVNWGIGRIFYISGLVLNIVVLSQFMEDLADREMKTRSEIQIEKK